MKRKYLEDLGVDIKNTPYGYCQNDHRQPKWDKQKEIYGFDSRETWNLDTAFIYWLYERLSMYNEVNIIDTQYRKFEIGDETLTFQQCIDELLQLTKRYITESLNSNETEKCIDRVLILFRTCFFSLWW